VRKTQSAINIAKPLKRPQYLAPASWFVTFRPTESKYSFVFLEQIVAVSLRGLMFDMARLAILAIMPPVMSKQQHFV
jgi:hypothetical protein